MKSITLSKFEKVFWVLTFFLSWPLGFVYFLFFGLLLIFRFRLSHNSSNLNLNSEIIDNFLYSPVSGLVMEVDERENFNLICLKSLPIFGDMLFSPGDLEVRDVFSPREKGTSFNIVLETKESEKLTISVSPYFDMISSSSSLQKGDKIAKYSSFMEIGMGGDVFLEIPKSHSLQIKKGSIIWARKSVISGKHE